MKIVEKIKEFVCSSSQDPFVIIRNRLVLLKEDEVRLVEALQTVSNEINGLKKALKEIIDEI